MIHFKDKEGFKLTYTKKGFSQSSLSKAIGRDRSYLNIALKRNCISPNPAVKITEVLGMMFEEIFEIS